ncbi:MAG TPA: zinc-ribbon domain containing protein [Chloroflexia bacterium]|nr:zinc-ribbon domain containing protein [Chloroflexia bacterium]
MDKTLQCRDCGNSFTFTAGEQEFYNSRGYTEPQRCPDCRAAKKAARGNDSYSGGGGGGGGYGGGSSSGGYGRERAPRQMTQVTCSNCGRATEVPFVPTGDRPVYCSDCYSQMGGGNSRGGGGGNRSGGSRRY